MTFIFPVYVLKSNFALNSCWNPRKNNTILVQCRSAHLCNHIRSAWCDFDTEIPATKPQGDVDVSETLKFTDKKHCFFQSKPQYTTGKLQKIRKKKKKRRKSSSYGSPRHVWHWDDSFQEPLSQIHFLEVYKALEREQNHQSGWNRELVNGITRGRFQQTLAQDSSTHPRHRRPRSAKPLRAPGAAPAPQPPPGPAGPGAPRLPPPRKVVPQGDGGGRAAASRAPPLRGGRPALPPSPHPSRSAPAAALGQVGAMPPGPGAGGVLACGPPRSAAATPAAGLGAAAEPRWPRSPVPPHLSGRRAGPRAGRSAAQRPWPSAGGGAAAPPGDGPGGGGRRRGASAKCRPRSGAQRSAAGRAEGGAGERARPEAPVAGRGTARECLQSACPGAERAGRPWGEPPGHGRGSRARSQPPPAVVSVRRRLPASAAPGSSASCEGFRQQSRRQLRGFARAERTRSAGPHVS